MASEDKDGEVFVHFSYTIYDKNSTEEEKVGSLYIKVQYNVDEVAFIEGEKFSQNSGI